MNIKEFDKNIAISKGKAIWKCVIAKEKELFIPENQKSKGGFFDNLFEEKETDYRGIAYRINYFIAVFWLITTLYSIFNAKTDLIILLIIFGFFVYLKPVVHLCALTNRRKKKNIELYGLVYGRR